MNEEDLKIEVLKIESFADGLKQGAILLAKRLLDEKNKNLDKNSPIKKEE